MTTGLQFTYLYHDDDIVELGVTVSNGRFSGSTDVYIATDGTAEIVETLKGFPTNPQDTRDYTLGAFGPTYAGGAVHLHFFCRDRAGHATLKATVEDNFDKLPFTQQSVVLLEFEPAALDRFLAALPDLERNHAGTATLLG